MQRYFVDQPVTETGEYIISGDSARHISKVMRMTVGEEIIVVHSGEAHICEIRHGEVKHHHSLNHNESHFLTRETE